MQGVSEAGLILKRHVLERRMRGSVRSLCLDDDPGRSVPRMSEAEFILSSQLVRGVPEWVLDMLEIWVCESKGSTWTVDAVEIQGRLENIPLEQIAQRLTLSEAAERLGLQMTHTRARALYREAMSLVTDNLVERAARVAHGVR